MNLYLYTKNLIYSYKLLEENNNNIYKLKISNIQIFIQK